MYGLAALVVLVGIALTIPRVRSSLSFHIAQTYTTIKYALFPPEKSVFTPGQGGVDSVATAVQATLKCLRDALLHAGSLHTRAHANDHIHSKPIAGTRLSQGCAP